MTDEAAQPACHLDNEPWILHTTSFSAQSPKPLLANPQSSDGDKGLLWGFLGKTGESISTKPVTVQGSPHTVLSPSTSDPKPVQVFPGGQRCPQTLSPKGSSAGCIQPYRGTSSTRSLQPQHRRETTQHHLDVSSSSGRKTEQEGRKTGREEGGQKWGRGAGAWLRALQASPHAGRFSAFPLPRHIAMATHQPEQLRSGSASLPMEVWGAFFSPPFSLPSFFSP